MTRSAEEEEMEEFMEAIKSHQRELDAYNSDLWIKMEMYLVMDKLNLFVEEDTLLLGLWIEV